MNKQIVIVLSLLVSFLQFAQPVSAHILQTDKNIGAVLHIDPDDDPIVGEQSSFFFSIKDKQNKFSFANCSCTVTVKETGKIINQTTISDQTFLYTFPKKDVFQVILTGQPTNNSFQPFSLTYDIRVERETKNQSVTTNTASHITHLFVGGMILLFGIVVLIIKRRNEKNH